MYFKVNKSGDNFLTSKEPKKGYIEVDLNNADKVAEKLQLDFWTEGEFDENASLNYVKQRTLERLEAAAQSQRTTVLNEPPERLSYYTSKSALALQSLTNTVLLKQFEKEAKEKGITAEQLRDLVLQKSKLVYNAIDEIESKLTKAKLKIKSAKTQKKTHEILLAFTKKKV